MKIRVLSDLHLEHDTPAEIPACEADLVILAGDIANGRAGVDWAASTFDIPVVYVPGNHEYYESNFDTVDRLMADAAAEAPQVCVLNGAVAEFGGKGNRAAGDAGGGSAGDSVERVRVIGTTWWTDYCLFGTDRANEAMDACAGVMMDHRLIEIAGADGRLRHFTPEDAWARHLAATSWLAQTLSRPFDGKTVVVTHHGPDLGSLDPRYSHDLVSAGFLSRRPDLVARADLWVHGHTHTGFDYRIDNSRVVCNPRGYISRRTGELENRTFDWSLVVEI